MYIYVYFILIYAHKYILYIELYITQILLMHLIDLLARGLSKLELNGQRGTVLPLESPEQVITGSGEMVLVKGSLRSMNAM